MLQHTARARPGPRGIRRIRAAGATKIMQATTTMETAGAQPAVVGLTWIDKLTIAAIVGIVVLVTIPHVERLARRDNELDAMRTLRVLATQPVSPGSAQRDGTLRGLVGADQLLARRLEDSSWLPDGSMQRHGYRFDLARSAKGEVLLRAWPIEAGATGRASFLWNPRTGMLGHDNAALAWSGERAPGLDQPLDERSGWRRMAHKPR
ncbi:MAG: hypothetical protein RL112_1688 [Planctomycetota bacterium]|jgi:hypothetical protein